jgi:hypothetical protein
VLLVLAGLANLAYQMHMLGIGNAQLDGVSFRNTIADATRRVAHTVSSAVEGDGSSAATLLSGLNSVRQGLQQSDVNILMGILCFTTVLVGCCVLYLVVTSLRPTTRADVWEDVADVDEVLGDQPNLNRAADQRHVEMLDAINDASWRETLWTFFNWIRLDANWLNRMRARAERREARRRVDQKMLKMRDMIFNVRNTVFTKVSKEAVSKHTEANRLIVARHVEEVMERMSIQNPVRGQIREACVNACFIDTVYDKAGREIALGPPRRPV